MGRLFHKTADPRKIFVKEHVFGVKYWVPILSQDHHVMKQLWSQFFIGALVPSFALMPCLLTPSDRPLQTGTTWYVSRCRSRKQTFLEIAQMCEAACVCLRLRVRAHGDEHQKAFFELLCEEAIHFVYVMLASARTAYLQAAFSTGRWR